VSRYYLATEDDPEEARRELARRKLDNGLRTLWRAVWWVAGILVLGALVDWLGLA
jgi:hypothetical protein